MRLHIVAQAVRRALDELDRRDAIKQAIDSIPDSGHEWDVESNAQPSF
jgi:hypothetical protein